MEDKDTQEYISLLEAFKLSLADNKSPEKIQVIEQINKIADCKIKLNT